LSGRRDLDLHWTRATAKLYHCEIAKAGEGDRERLVAGALGRFKP
jgi:hypothetical protein